MKPPFIGIPDHVDGKSIFAAASRVESKIYAAMPEIDERLSKIEPLPNQPKHYYKHWFRRKYDNYLAYLQVYAYIISMAIPSSFSDLSRIRLLDFGGGWGLMGLVAKEAGIGHVEYVDINVETTRAAKAIGEGVGISLENYGTMASSRSEKGHEELSRSGGDRFDSVVSSDVLEHVYDVDKVFKAISHVCSPNAVVFHQTGANPRSPYIRRKLMNLQRSEETHNTKDLMNLHARGGKAIWETRKAYIESYAPNIQEPELDKLVRASRGLNQADLQNAVDNFQFSGIYPVPDHPTNCCYLNGYWIERLMDPDYVRHKMSKHGFQASIERTYWGVGRTSYPKRMIKHGLNMLSSLSMPLAMKFSFYYAVRGTKLD